MHLIARILLSCNYCGNLTHKVSECNIPSKDLFCDYYGKEGHQEVVLFCQVPEMEVTLITMAKSTSIFRYPSTKNQTTSTLHLGFPHQG